MRDERADFSTTPFSSFTLVLTSRGWQTACAIFILVILAVIIANRLHRSRFGRALEYIREDEDAAEAMGINTVRFKLLAYIVGSLFAGVAGSFYAIKMTAVAPESFLFTQSANVLLAIVLGGMGKFPGLF